MKLQRLGELITDGQERIQRGHGILKDHRDPVATQLAQAFSACVDEVFAFETDGVRTDDCRWGWDQSEDGQVQHGFSRAAFADQTGGGAWLDAQIHSVDSFHQAIRCREVGLEIFDFKQTHVNRRLNALSIFSFLGPGRLAIRRR